MARRNYNMLEAFKVSREQAIEARRQALEPPQEGMAQRFQRSLQRSVGKGSAARGKGDLARGESGSGTKRGKTILDSNQESDSPVAAGFKSISGPEHSSAEEATQDPMLGVDELRARSGESDAGVGQSSDEKSDFGVETLEPCSSAVQQNQAARAHSAVMPQPPRPLVEYDARSEPMPEVQVEKGIHLSAWTLIGFSITLAGLSFVLGLQIGRGGDASNPNQAETQTAGIGAPALQHLPDPGALPVGADGRVAGSVAEEDGVQAVLPNPADLAFEDPRNHFTLVVDQYNDNRLGRERAIAHYRYLKGQGFPVIQPRLRGDVVYLLVGAAKDRPALGDLLSEVHALAYPGSQDRTFSNAFLSSIDFFF